MKTKSLYAIVVLILIAVLSWYFWPKYAYLEPVSFEQLPEWNHAGATRSLVAFENSCHAFLKQKDDKNVGSRYIPITAQVWKPICKALKNTPINNDKQARQFIRNWFTPYAFLHYRDLEGLFTGYYLPLLHGSYVKTEKYNIPLYGIPSNLVTINLEQFNSKYAHEKITGRVVGHRVLPFYTRKQINQGALHDKAPIIVWVDNLIDRFYLEIQGSGIVELENGKKIFVGYIAENGAPYTAIGKVLVQKGVLSREQLSMQSIREYLTAHPSEIKEILNQNESFIFFSILPKDAVLGSQGVALTAGYSLAVDRKYIPMGAPLWLSTTYPDANDYNKSLDLNRLMIAQDTGGAIKGIVRGDVFWGAGKDASAIAGHMKNKGQYWILLPKSLSDQVTRIQLKIN